MTEMDSTQEWTSVSVSTLSPDEELSEILYTTATGAKITKTYFISCVATLLLAIWIILLNAIVIYTLLCHRLHTRVSDYFVSCLSVADLVTGIVMIYITTYSLLQYQNFWECLFRFGMTYTISECSYIHLFAMTINRYIKIVRPLHYDTIFTKRRVVLISLLIWAISLTLGLLPIMGWRESFAENSDDGTVCRFFGVLPDKYFIFHMSINTFMITVTVILYGRIIYIARQHYHTIQGLTERFQETTTTQPMFDSHSWRLAKTIAIVVVVSNLCWLPGVIVILLHTSGSLRQFSITEQGDMVTYCGLTVFLNSLINPIIYTSKISIVNKRFRAIFCCKKQQRPNTQGIQNDRPGNAIEM